MKTSKIRQTIFLATLLVIAQGTSYCASPAAYAKGAEPSLSTPAKTTGQKLHRADFRVSGASCVACLRRVGKKIRDQQGVLKADVSIFKPYWAIVIYEPNKITMEKIYNAVKDEKIKFEDIEDKTISEIPLIVIPKGLTKGSEPAKASTH